MDARPPLDPLSADYVALAFGIERLVPGYVDAYVGPPDARAMALAGPAPGPADLLAAARALAVRVAEADVPDTRVGYLAAQAQAMIATCRRLTGEVLDYPDEVRLLFDIDVERTPAAAFEAAAAELDDLVPGDGPLPARLADWRRRFAVSPDMMRTLIDAIVPEIRARTLALTDLPPGEAVEFRMVRDEPWRAYNWYLGDARSRVEFNTDLPVHANELVGLLCHEAYPGHHAEHGIKERRLYRARGWGEHAIFLVNTPECVVSEGVATLAEAAIFPDEDEAARFLAERVLPAAGLGSLSAEAGRDAAIRRAQRALRGVDGNAALLLHADGAAEAEVVAYLVRHGLRTEPEARQRLRFLTEPLWRPYVFTYSAGHDLLGAWLATAPDAAERAARFRTLLTEQVFPSRVREWLADEP